MPSEEMGVKQTHVIIIDVTRMGGGNVCIAGVDFQGKSVRPVPDRGSGINETSLFNPNGRQVIHPWSILSFNFVGEVRKPPHIEDRIFITDPPPARIGVMNNAGAMEVLRGNCSQSIDELFEGHLTEGKYILPGAPTRSLGTVQPEHIEWFTFPEMEGKLKYRIIFKENSGQRRSFQVTDLKFRNFVDVEMKGKNMSEKRFAARLTKAIQSAKKLYLRVGLARPWLKEGESEKRCYVQINGIHSFPDYFKIYSEMDAAPRSFTAPLPDATLKSEISTEGWSEDEQDKLFESLRILRARIARENEVPAYIVFHDVALRAMAEKRPVSKEEFLELPHVGPVKWATYGEDFLKRIRDHLRTETHFQVRECRETYKTKRNFTEQSSRCRICGEYKPTRGVIFGKQEHLVCMDCHNEIKMRRQKTERGKT